MPANAQIRVLFLLLAASALGAQQLPEEVLLLSRVRRHVTEELTRLPDVSCLETVQRENREPRGKLHALDTVRLEVLTNGTDELYASPGDRKFSHNPPIQWVGSGAMGTGFFGLYLKTAFLNSNTLFSWKGDEDIGGRPFARWDFRIPLQGSGQTFNLVEGSGHVSLSGSFWADRATLDVVRLRMQAGDIPPSLPLDSAGWTIDYAPTTIAAGKTVLLPQSADFQMVWLSGQLAHNAMSFTQCRAFEAETTIRFDDQDAVDATPAFSASAIDDTLRALPAGIKLTVQLNTRITGQLSVGGLIEGVIANDAIANKQVVIPAGSVVRGRIRRLESNADPTPFSTVAIEYTEVIVHGIRYRFDADLLFLDPSSGAERALTFSQHRDNFDTLQPANIEHQEKISATDIPGVATFFVRGSALNLPSGFKTEWMTHALSKSGKAAH